MSVPDLWPDSQLLTVLSRQLDPSKALSGGADASSLSTNRGGEAQGGRQSIASNEICDQPKKGGQRW